jgi:hypothetical protein
MKGGYRDEMVCDEVSTSSICNTRPILCFGAGLAFAQGKVGYSSKEVVPYPQREVVEVGDVKGYYAGMNQFEGTFTAATPKILEGSMQDWLPGPQRRIRSRGEFGGPVGAPATLRVDEPEEPGEVRPSCLSLRGLFEEASSRPAAIARANARGSEGVGRTERREEATRRGATRKRQSGPPTPE